MQESKAETSGWPRNGTEKLEDDAPVVLRASRPRGTGMEPSLHSFAFLQALPEVAGRLAVAHERVLERDEGPGVPVRTSDHFVSLDGAGKVTVVTGDSPAARTQ